MQLKKIMKSLAANGSKVSLNLSLYVSVLGMLITILVNSGFKGTGTHFVKKRALVSLSTLDKIIMKGSIRPDALILNL